MIDEYQINTIRERFVSLEDELKLVHGERFYTKSSKTIIESIELLILANNHWLDTILEGLSDDIIDEDRAERYIERIHKTIKFLYRVIEILNNSSRKEIAIELVRPFERYVQIFLPNYEVMLESCHELNYGYSPLKVLLESQYQSLGIVFKDSGVYRVGSKLTDAKELGKLPKGIVVLSIPKAEKHNVLFYAILGHEIGHGLYENIEAKYGNFEKNNIELLLNNLITKAPNNYQSLENMSEEDKSTLGEYFRQWFEEIVSDIVGILLFGPASIFAYANIFLPLSKIDKTYKTHPPDIIRLEAALRLLKGDLDANINYTSAIKAHSAIDEYIEKLEILLAENSVFNGNNIERLAAKLVEEELPKIIPTIISIVGSDNIYTGTMYQEDIDKYSKLLKNIIPLVEEMPLNKNSAPMDLPSILNIGWFIYIAEIDDIMKNYYGDKLDRNKRNEQERKIKRYIQDIVLKSIELSEIKNQWLKYEGQYVAEKL